MLFAALDAAGTSLSRQQATQSILANRWFAIQDEDRHPYLSQTGAREPRWKTLIAWARKDAILRGYLIGGERDSWALSRQGHSTWDSLRTRFRSGELPVREGYLWSQQFKLYLFAAYEPTPADAVRPVFFYRDLQASVLASIMD